MEYKKIETRSYNIHFIKTNKFKTMIVDIIFRDEIKKDEITKRNMLLDNLTFSSKKYNTKRKMAIAKQDLYGLDIRAVNRRLGNQILTGIYLTMLNPKYTEQNMIEKSIKFLADLIFNPNVSDNGFEKELFDNIKEDTIADIKNKEDNPRNKIMELIKEEVDKTKAFSYHMSGYLEDAKKITNKNLYDYYQKVLKTNLIDIYVAGDFDFYDVEKLIKENFKFDTIKKPKKDIEINYIPKGKEKEKIINSKYNQSNLALAGGFANISKRELEYVIPLYNIILGNSPDSKLFKHVREEKSYAYTISASYRMLDKVFAIYAGISNKNYNDCLNAIKKELNEMKLGNFTEKDINNAKEIFISVINDFDEYYTSIVDYYFNIEYLKSDDLKAQIKEIKKINKDEIVALAKKIKIDSIVLLKEHNNEKN